MKFSEINDPPKNQKESMKKKKVTWMRKMYTVLPNKKTMIGRKVRA